MRRERVVSPGTQEYESAEVFLASTPGAGTHAVQVGDQWLDILFEDRGADTTLVAFHGAASERIQTLPYFTGRGLAASVGWNLVAVSDPSLALGDVDLTWFLGNRALGPLHEKLSPLIRHLLGDTHPVLFGGSGGAYAAILFGQDFPGSTVVVFNPRLNLGAAPVAPVVQYLQECHRTAKPVSLRTIRRNFIQDDLGALYEEGLPFDLYVLQNSGDKVYMRNQLQPFERLLSKDPRLHVTLEYFGGGHKAAISQDFLRGFLLAARSAKALR